VGYSIETIRKIENGERRPSRQVAEPLAHGLELTPGVTPDKETRRTNIVLRIPMGYSYGWGTGTRTPTT
jgi:transcriptional regulator with XRE-family HTH domain